MFCALGAKRIGFEDFRRNGLLLPSSEDAVHRIGLPLHRGPHRHYNEMVEHRVGQIEVEWRRTRSADGVAASAGALMRLELLQAALRQRLLSAQARPIRLNRKDPLGAGLDFSELDAMAEMLWQASEPAAESGIPAEIATPDQAAASNCGHASRRT